MKTIQVQRVAIPPSLQASILRHLELGRRLRDLPSLFGYVRLNDVIAAIASLEVERATEGK